SSNPTNSLTLADNYSIGDWRCIVYAPIGGTVKAVTSFTVVDSANPVADLQIDKTPISNEPAAGSQVRFGLQVTNNGPSPASAPQLSDAVPANTTFLSFTQLTGPAFSCNNPFVDGTGTTVCTINSLNKGDTATFVATYRINAGTAVGTEISNTATLSGN